MPHIVSVQESPNFWQGSPSRYHLSGLNHEVVWPPRADAEIKQREMEFQETSRGVFSENRTVFVPLRKTPVTSGVFQTPGATYIHKGFRLWLDSILRAKMIL